MIDKSTPMFRPKRFRTRIFKNFGDAEEKHQRSNGTCDGKRTFSNCQTTLSLISKALYICPKIWRAQNASTRDVMLNVLSKRCPSTWSFQEHPMPGLEEKALFNPHSGCTNSAKSLARRAMSKLRIKTFLFRLMRTTCAGTLSVSNHIFKMNYHYLINII